MNRPVIAVCIVTCNQEDFIGKCLSSVLAQEVCAELRVLVGDDASQDATSEILERMAAEHPGIITHIRHETRLGPLANMRGLIASARGDFIARLDGDDFWLPGKLQQQLDFMKAHPDCSAVYANAIAVDEKGVQVGLFNDVGNARFDLASLLRRGNFLNNSSVLFRSAGRHAWLDVNAPQIDYRVHLWHARYGWLGHISEPLAAYRVGVRGSMVAEMNDRVRDLYWEAILSVPQELVSDSDMAHGIADFLRRTAFRSFRTRNMALLSAWWPRAVRSAPCGKVRLLALAVANIFRAVFQLSFWGGLVWIGLANRVLHRR